MEELVPIFSLRQQFFLDLQITQEIHSDFAAEKFIYFSSPYQFLGRRKPVPGYYYVRVQILRVTVLCYLQAGFSLAYFCYLALAGFLLPGKLIPGIVLVDKTRSHYRCNAFFFKATELGSIDRCAVGNP